MATSLKVYVNDDDALLFWRPSSLIPNCRGFAVQRRRRTSAGVEETYLPNRIGFATEPVIGLADAGADDAPLTRPSTTWPFQRLSWIDHDADRGDRVSYRVIPAVRDCTGRLVLLDEQASPWSAECTLGETPAGTYRPSFNRALVISQFMARYLAENNLTLAQFTLRITSEVDETFRRFLAGGLRRAILDLIDATAGDDFEVYAALFELTDHELVEALTALGPRAHIVLANGSTREADGDATAQARIRDENRDARAKLVVAGVDVEEGHRFTTPGRLGHNKFLVRTHRGGQPVSVWTGSTNWTATGLCTQVNNGLLIEDPAIAQVYLEHWHRLRNAGSGFPPELLVDDVAHELRCAGGQSASATVWFTRSPGHADLDALRDVVSAARQGVLFLMFMPGATGLYADVLARSTEPDLYVRGVVSELPRGRGDERQADVNLVDGATRHWLSLDIVQPEGIEHRMAQFAAAVAHKQFLAHVGHAIVHSEVLVVDPFSADCAVVTGSHNFCSAASSKNDEDFVIIRGDRPLAQAYAVNVMSVYAHYRWRSHLGQTRRPFNGLRDDDRWLAPMLRDNARDLDFWGLVGR